MLAKIVRQSLLNKSNITRTFACGVDPNLKTKRQEVLQRRQERQVVKVNKKRKSLIDYSKPMISITDEGWNEIVQCSDDKSVFYLSALSSGSSCGFEYDFKLLDINEIPDLENTSHITHPKKDVKVYIDNKRQLLLLGSNIDYKDKNYKKGRYESGFVITGNSSLSSNCSCNRSFRPIDL